MNAGLNVNLTRLQKALKDSEQEEIVETIK